LASSTGADGSLIALALGSMAYPYALLFYSHALAMAAAGGAFAVAVRLVHDAGQRPRRGALLVGGLGGLAVLADYQAAIALVGIVAYLSWRSRDRIRDLAWAAAGGAPFAAVLGFYHWACFGAPWRTGYAFAPDPAHRLGALGVIGPNATALVQALFAPDNGLIVLMPWVLLAVIGAVSLVRVRATRAEAVVAAAIALAYVLFVGSLVPEFGRAGWSVGPRYITCALPFFAWLAAAGLAVIDSHILARIAGQALVLVGVVIMVVAGTTFPHWPTAFRDPLYQVSFWLLARGDAPHSIGTAIGLRGLASLVPLYLIVAILVVVLMGPNRRRLWTLGIAAAIAAVLVGALSLVPHPILPQQAFVESIWEPR
jgi:hypothetical protein